MAGVIPRSVVTTPNRGRTLGIALAVWYLLLPVMQGYFELSRSAEGRDPLDVIDERTAIVRLLIAFAILSPVMIAIIWLACRRYVGAVSLWRINRERPVWTTVWSLLTLVIVAYYLNWAWVFFVNEPSYPMVSAFWLIGVWLALCVRSAIVFKKRN